MNISFLHSFWTVFAFVFFIGVVIWAWGAGRKKDFEHAARMPLEDEKPVIEDSKIED